jgi:hypothetical protein
MQSGHDSLTTKADKDAAAPRHKKLTSTEIAFSHANTLIKHMEVEKQARKGLELALGTMRLFDFSRAHASPMEASLGGLFWDPYSREGVAPPRGLSLAKTVCIDPVTGDDSLLQYIYSYEMHPIIEEILKKYPLEARVKFEPPVDYLGCRIGRIQVPKDFKLDMLTFLGSIGAIPPQETLLQLFIRLNIREEQKIPAFSHFLSYRHKEEFVYNGTLIKPMRYLDTLKGFDAIIAELAKLSELCRETPSLDINNYYYQVTLELVKGLKRMLDKEPPRASEYIFFLAVNRIADLINTSKACEYTEFLECISLIWDEIRWLTTKPIHESAAPRSIYDEIMAALRNYSEHLTDCAPAYTNLGTSGMNVLVKSIHAALKESTANGTKSAAIQFGRFNYFELNFFMRIYLECPMHLGAAHHLYTDGSKEIEKPDDWHEGLVSVYIDIPLANVQTKIAGLKYTHVNDVIEEQLKLRAELAKKGQNSPPLICILDMTVSYMDDVTMKWILFQFSEAIDQGQLYIFFGHSLNKLWTMGLDKGYAGFCHQYGNLDHFPHLKQLAKQETAQMSLGGHSIYSSTVSFIALVMSSCPDLIDTYSELIHGRSRYVYGEILKPLIGRNDVYISIDDPQSYPLLKGSEEPLMALADYSTFVTIRLNDAYGIDDCFGRQFMTCASLLLAEVGIMPRDGYGFAKTIFTSFNTVGSLPVLRVNIGGESVQVLESRFKRIKDFIIQYNQVISQYYPLECDPKITKDPALKLKVMKELLEVYINQFPQDDWQPLIRALQR